MSETVKYKQAHDKKSQFDRKPRETIHTRNKFTKKYR